MLPRPPTVTRTDTRFPYTTLFRAFYTEGVQEGLFSPTGGGVDAAKADSEFYTEAGQMEGPAESLKVEDFWDLGPLNAAKRSEEHTSELQSLMRISYAVFCLKKQRVK